MAVAIRYKVPYKVTAKAHDTASLKPITNAFFYRTAGSVAAPPSYGAPILGSSSTDTFAASFLSAFGNIRTLMNTNYQMDEVIVQSIIGKKFRTPVSAITSMISTVTGIDIATAVPHGLTTGDLVNVFGVNLPAAANGVWSVGVVNPTRFSLIGSTTFSVWSGDGFWQKATGALEFLYGDSTSLVTSDAGSIVGEALPLFSSASVRRLNDGLGRHFRSRLSFSPMSESDNEDGAWENATKAAWVTGLDAFLTDAVVNGGTDLAQGTMQPIVVSQGLAVGLASPFAQSDTWTSKITSMVLQRNSGSLVRRKPKLTSPITVVP